MGATSETTSSARRRIILDAAERLIYHYGFDKTTVADIARAAGIGVGTVYLEFDSKEEIAGELSRVCHAKLIQAMTEAACCDASFAKRLRRIFDARTECLLNLEATGHHAVELVLHRTCTGITAERQRFAAEQERILESLLQQAHTAREFHVDDPRLMARALLHAYAAFAPPALHERTKGQTSELIEATHQLVTNGLLRRS